MVETYKLFNLIVAHEPNREARRRVLRFVKSLAPMARVFAMPTPLILFSVKNPYSVVNEIRVNITADTPILRAIPVDLETPPYVEDVAAVVERLIAERARSGDTFAVRLEGRLYTRQEHKPLHKRDSITIIARSINLPVNLSRPSILVLVKTVRVQRAQRYAAIMVAPPSSIYSRAKGAG